MMELHNEQKVESFMAKVFFLDLFEEQIAKKQIARFEEHVDQYLQELYKEREKYMLMNNQECFYYKLSTLYFGIVKLQSLLEWCKVVKEKESLENLVR